MGGRGGGRRLRRINGGIRLIEVEGEKKKTSHNNCSVSCVLFLSASTAPIHQTPRINERGKGIRKKRDPPPLSLWRPYREQAPTQSARRSAAPAPPSKSVAGSTGSGFFFSSWPPLEEEAIVTKEEAAVLWRKLRGIRGAEDEGRMRRPLWSEAQEKSIVRRGKVSGLTDEKVFSFFFRVLFSRS